MYQPLQFASLVVSVQDLVHNQNLDCLRFLTGTSSTVTSIPYLMSSAIVSISRSIRLRAANFHQSESGTPDSIYGSLSLSWSKRIRMLLRQHLTFSFILKFASTRSYSLTIFGTKEGYYVCPVDAGVEALLNQNCNGSTLFNTIMYF